MTSNVFFLGSPCVGKSTLSHGLTYELSKRGMSVAFVEESARRLTNRGLYSQMDNQLYVSGLYWEDILSVQDKCDVLVSDSHPLVGIVYCSNVYKQALNLETLYKSISDKSICIVVEPPLNMKENYDSTCRQQDYEGSMHVWLLIKNQVIPLLDPSHVLYVNRNVSLDELSNKVINLFNICNKQ